MSDTMTRIDPRAELSGWARQLSHMFCVDLKHIPADAYTQPHGGKARTVSDIVAEVAGLNMMMVSILNDMAPSMPSDEEKAGYIATLTNVDACTQAITSSCEALAQAIQDTNEDDLTTEVTAPWGMTMSKYAFANIVVNNIWYHDGQLNYLQSLHGDDQIHWME